MVAIFNQMEMKQKLEMKNVLFKICKAKWVLKKCNDAFMLLKILKLYNPFWDRPYLPRTWGIFWGFKIIIPFKLTNVLG